MAYLTVVSATKGRKFGFFTVLGVTLGLLVIGLAAAAGLAKAIASSAFLYQSLRISGVLYLFWLALEEWRNANDPLEKDNGVQHSKISYFRHGLVLNILNPKAGVFYITILPSFIDSTEPILPQAIVLTLISIVIATLIHVLIVSFAGFLKPLLNKPKRISFIRRGLAVMLAGIALWFGFGT